MLISAKHGRSSGCVSKSVSTKISIVSALPYISPP
jgi:hypothetical protein